MSIEKGISILLEKPICPTKRRCWTCATPPGERNADITVAHVLRHTTFFSQIRGLLDSGVIGRLQTVQHTEQIGYWHFAHSYVRGNWRRRSDSSPMIVAKACHDFDMLRWLVGARCEKLSSFGNLGHFTAGERAGGLDRPLRPGLRGRARLPLFGDSHLSRKIPAGRTTGRITCCRSILRLRASRARCMRASTAAASIAATTMSPIRTWSACGSPTASAPR